MADIYTSSRESLNTTTVAEEAARHEAEAYSEHIQNLLADDRALWESHLPFSAENDLYAALTDGILLSHIMAKIKPGCLDLKTINHKVDRAQIGTKAGVKDTFEATANLNRCFDPALTKQLGVVTVNIAAEDFMHKKVDLVLGLIWQLVRAHLLSAITIAIHPELVRLLEPGENLVALCQLTSEQTLIRWVNYHLARAGTTHRIAAFGGKDIQDGVVYLHLLEQIVPAANDALHADIRAALAASATLPTDGLATPRAVLELAERIGCRRFVTAADIAAGHPRLNLAFVATLFNKYTGIHLPSEDEMRAMVERADRLEAENVALHAALVEARAAGAAATAQGAATASALEAATSELDQLAAATAAKQAEWDRVGALRAEMRAHLHDGPRLAQLVGKAWALVHPPSPGTDAGADGEAEAPATREMSQLTTDPDADAAELNDAQIADQLVAMVHDLLMENAEQRKFLQVLATRDVQNQKINEMIGDKIREYSEARIHEKNDKQRKKKEIPKK